MQRRQPRSIH
jgi:hypothetical protein